MFQLCSRAGRPAAVTTPPCWAFTLARGTTHPSPPHPPHPHPPPPRPPPPRPTSPPTSPCWWGPSPIPLPATHTCSSILATSLGWTIFVSLRPEFCSQRWSGPGTSPGSLSSRWQTRWPCSAWSGPSCLSLMQPSATCRCTLHPCWPPLASTRPPCRRTKWWLSWIRSGRSQILNPFRIMSTEWSLCEWHFPEGLHIALLCDYVLHNSKSLLHSFLENKF